MLDTRLGQFIRALPKAQIHLHLEGSVPADRAARLAANAGIAIPGLIKDHQAPHGYRYAIPDFAAFIDLYVALSSCLVNEAQIIEIIDAVCDSLRAENVRYAEITFTPLTIIRAGFAEDALLAALLSGKQQAREKHGIEIQWVFDFVRSIPDQAMATVDLALKARARGIGVVAFGVGGPEGPQYPAQPLAPAFDKARAQALPAVPHAGEQTGAWAVWDALDLFHARRIGHGIRSVEDPGLLDRLRDERICLEVCPASNIELVHVPSYARHPVNKLIEHGIPVTLAADDPGLLDTTLFDQYAGCAEAFGWDAERICRVAETGVSCSFASETAKAELGNLQRACLADFRASVAQSATQGDDRG